MNPTCYSHIALRYYKKFRFFSILCIPFDLHVYSLVKLNHPQSDNYLKFRIHKDCFVRTLCPLPVKINKWSVWCLYSVIKTIICKINSTNRGQFIFGFTSVFRSNPKSFYPQVAWITLQEPCSRNILHSNGPKSLHTLLSTRLWSRGNETTEHFKLFPVFPEQEVQHVTNKVNRENTKGSLLTL